MMNPPRKNGLRTTCIRIGTAHWGFFLLLGVAVAIRFVFWINLRPYLMFADSWIYVNDTSPLRFLPYRPAGYVFILALLRAQSNLGIVTLLQHLAGLGTGILTYNLVFRKTDSQLLASTGAALYLLSAYTILLERFVMTESFFAFLLIASFRLAALYPVDVRRLSLSGLLLAGACLLRAAGAFAIPFWVGWLLRQKPIAWKRIGIAVACLAVPLSTYIGARNSATDYGSLGLTRAEGWFLYGRTMSFANCDALRIRPALKPLCPVDKPSQIPEWFMWSPESPARKFFKEDDASSNEVVREVALNIVSQQPMKYLAAIRRDFLRGFLPGGGGDQDVSLTLTYVGGKPNPFDPDLWPASANISRKFQIRYETPRVSMDSFIATYRKRGRIPRTLLGILGMIPILVAAIQLNRHREDLSPGIFLSLTGFGMFALSVALSAFELRYMVPLVPLFSAAGMIGMRVLTRD